MRNQDEYRGTEGTDGRRCDHSGGRAHGRAARGTKHKTIEEVDEMAPVAERPSLSLTVKSGQRITVRRGGYYRCNALLG